MENEKIDDEYLASRGFTPQLVGSVCYWTHQDRDIFLKQTESGWRFFSTLGFAVKDTREAFGRFLDAIE